MDLDHKFGEDLVLDGTGDLALADGVDLGQQRVLRRLLTAPGDYIWQPDYGAGLQQYIGQPVSEARLTALVRAQIYREAIVARRPSPSVTVEVDPATGNVLLHVGYVSLPSNQSVQLTAPIYTPAAPAA